MKTQGDGKRTIRRSAQTEGAEPEPVMEPAVDQETIARLAYSYWEVRGCQEGIPEEDWFKAESELRIGKKPNRQP